MNPILRIMLILSRLFMSEGLSAPPSGNKPNVLDYPADSPQGVLSYLSHEKNKLYSDPSFETGKKVANWYGGIGPNPEELGEYVEGDILFPNDQLMYRNGLKSPSARWPNKIIPYTISWKFGKYYARKIQEAMNDYHTYTCIKFKPYTGKERDFIHITADKTGCHTSVGRQGGRQIVNLQIPECVIKKGTIIHELMHALGFLHEHSRYERDNYITVNWFNVANPGCNKINFWKIAKEVTEDFGVEYDYASVMHYSPYAFTKNGGTTIIPRRSTNAVIGQRNSFSVKDVQKLNKMYRCSLKCAFAVLPVNLCPDIWLRGV